MNFNITQKMIFPYHLFNLETQNTPISNSTHPSYDLSSS